MKHQYLWLTKLLASAPRLQIPKYKTDDCDDDFVSVDFKEGGEDDEYDVMYHGGHDHGGANQNDKELYDKSMFKLKLVSFVSVFFIICQCIGGYLANSIAIFTDTAHLASDMVGFMMSMVAMKMSMRPASKELTFGWHRAEIIGTMVSVIFLLTLTIWLVFEATGRVVDPQEVKGPEMAITAIMGLFFNLIQMKILHQGEGGYHMGGGGCSHDHGDGKEEDHKEHSHAEGEKCDHEHTHDHEEVKDAPKRRNINVDAAFLHALGDMIMSIGVCTAGAIIFFQPKWVIADPVCTFVFSVIVCFTVTPIVKDCISVLMEGSPSEVDTDALIADIRALSGADDDVDVHDFHIWSISVGKYALSAHITTRQPMEILKKVTQLCKSKYNIDHLAIQVEDSSDNNQHKFDCEQTLHQTYDLPASPSQKKK